MTAATLLDRLEGVRETGTDRWLARCPAHDDRSPSLSVRDVGDRLLVHCFAGCDALDVVHAVGLELTDLFADKIEHRQSRPRRMPAGDRLLLLEREADVVGILAADFLKNRTLTDTDWRRLSNAISRIGKVRHA